MTAFTCSHNLTHLRGGRRIGEGCVRISVNVGMREREKDKTKRREETEEAEERSRKKLMTNYSVGTVKMPEHVGSDLSEGF